MSGERKKTFRTPEKLGPLDAAEAEGVVGGVSTETNRTSTSDADGPDDSTWDGGFTRPD